MPKLKTHQATAKRFRFSGRKKIRRRKAGQDHFNARLTGKMRGNKRGLITVKKVDERAIRELVPYQE